MNQTQEFLHTLIVALVDKPDEVKIERTVDEMGVLLTLSVNPEDMGKVIGRKGATAKAIRTLLRVAGMRHNERVNLKILEPIGGYTHQQEHTSRPFAADVDETLDDLRNDFT